MGKAKLLLLAWSLLVHHGSESRWIGGWMYGGDRGEKVLGRMVEVVGWRIDEGLIMAKKNQLYICM